jgi:hypothetical protein
VTVLLGVKGAGKLDVLVGAAEGDGDGLTMTVGLGAGDGAGDGDEDGDGDGESVGDGNGVGETCGPLGFFIASTEDAELASAFERSPLRLD